MDEKTALQEAAAALGRIGGKSRSKKKIDAVNQNLIKANKALTADARKARAKKAAAARWSKAKTAEKETEK